VACSAVGSCVAVGSDSDAKPVIETLSGGTWVAPGDAAAAGASELDGVACPAQGSCVAVGLYSDQNGDSRGLIETLSGGRWTATRAPLPAGAVPAPATVLVHVACPAAGWCIVVGEYAESRDTTAPFVDTLSGGTWTPATVPLPADAVPGSLSGISCWTPGNCVTVGYYTSPGGQPRYLAETLSGGTWTAATLPLPAGAAANQTSKDWSAYLSAVACKAPGSCVALGTFLAGGKIEGAIDTLSAGAWTAAQAPVPAGAATAKQWLYFYSAVCPAPGNCVAVGYFAAQDGSGQALIETATGKHG
jgi:hypothetical protein